MRNNVADARRPLAAWLSVSLAVWFVASFAPSPPARGAEKTPAAPATTDAKTRAAAVLAEVLEPTRKKHNLPALAAAVILNGRLAAVDAVGVRKAGTNVKVTRGDQFHLGSCTKAMTATLIGLLVEQGKLRWDTTLAAALPKLAGKMHQDFKKVTVRQLLQHRAGLNPNLPKGLTWRAMLSGAKTARQQREQLARAHLSRPPIHKPGGKYLYSNAGYGIVGAVVEAVTDQPYEKLMRKMLFEPLGMTSAGFGAMGARGKIDQPLQHQIKKDGTHRAYEPGPHSDNPDAIGPGGKVHCSLSDWAKFIVQHLPGPPKDERLLKDATLRTLHTCPEKSSYAMGWAAAQRSWGGGTVLTHAGCNTMNYAVAWLAPKKNFAVLVATNQGNGGAAKATDEVAAAVVRACSPDQPAPPKAVRGAKGPTGPSEAELQNLKRAKQMSERFFARMDKNKDGKITLEEIPERGREIFKRVDTNKDGAITPAEDTAFRIERMRRPDQGRRRRRPEPTEADVQYGRHDRNVLDFWQAKSDKPTPLVVYIHGGGFRGGDKRSVQGETIEKCLANGVSFAAINYRYRTTIPLVQILHEDISRAIQFLRYKADKWNLDKKRVAAYGGSAGAGSSLWLAFHDDLADAKSSDPILRESTRLTAAGARNGQATYDCQQWAKIVGVPESWVEKYRFTDDLAFYGIKDRKLVDTPNIRAIRKKLDMLSFMDAGDAAVHLTNASPNTEPTSRGAIIHHPRHSIAVKKRCDQLGIDAVIVLRDTPREKRVEMLNFFFKKFGLTAKKPKPAKPKLDE